MNIVYYTSAMTGSGHIIRGIALYNGFTRVNETAFPGSEAHRGVDFDYTILSSSPFAALAERAGVQHLEIPFEEENRLSSSTYRNSTLYNTLIELSPDVMVVDHTWYMFYAFLDKLPFKTVFITRQVAEAGFAIPVNGRSIRFDPEQYGLALKIEPFDTGIPSVDSMAEINPVIIRNRDEILSRAEARDRLGLQQHDDRPVCFFAFNGKPGEFETVRKSYSYLEDEGYQMVYSSNFDGGLFPLADYFNACDLLICGAGYNAFWEATYFEKEALFIPVPRRFESQEKRIDQGSVYRFDRNGADQLAENILGM
jgi:hypothetical protein